MKTRAFGSTGVMVPVIGEGTWNMEQDRPDDAKRAIARSIELGMTHLDTAELYGAGKVEELVGQAIRGLPRDRLFIVSKVMPSNATRAGVIKSCEASLRRLGTNHLDCYLLHWPGPHPLEDTFEAFEQLLAQGKIKSYGVSNFDVDELKQAEKICGPRKLACNQVMYHLEEREIEWNVIPWCKQHGIAVVAYSPFGSSERPWSKAAAKKTLEEIGRAHGAGPHAVALAFLIRDEALFAIPKSSDVAHVEANAKAGELDLSAEELARIDAAFPRARERGQVPTL